MKLWLAVAGVLLGMLTSDMSAGQSAQFAMLPNAQSFLSGTTYGSQNGGVVALEGYWSVGDGGGGLFASLPQSQQTYCMTTQGEIPNGETPSLMQIQNVQPFPLGLVVGMEVTGTNIQQSPPTTVASFSVVQRTISLSQPATAPSGSGTPYEISLVVGNTANPTGWTFIDTPGNCFTRISSNYTQKEWGAYSDGQGHSGETNALQNWLYANEPHMASAGNSIIDSSLYCGVYPYNSVSQSYPPATDGAVIEGPPASAVSQPDTNPSFLISSDDLNQGQLNQNFVNAGAMLVMGTSQCGIAATGFRGNSSSQTSRSNYDLVDADVAHNSVLNNSQLLGGWNGVNCSHVEGTNAQYADFTVEDSSIALTAHDGVLGHCPNLKIEGNIISGATASGIEYPATQGLVEDNILQQSNGNALSCTGRQLAFDGNIIDDNGLSASNPYFNLQFEGCNAASVFGNIFYRSGGGSQGTGQPTSQVYFADGNDSIAMAGNANLVGNDVSSPIMRPDYDIELDSTSNGIVTNMSYDDPATPQNAVTGSQNGIFGPRAAALIAPLYQPVQQNYITGLTTTMVSGQSEELNIQPGTAADSLNVQLLTLPAPCTVNLSNPGVQGLDTGQLAPNKQYNYFVFAQGGYQTGTSCIATLAPSSSPNFAATFNDGGSAAPYSTLSGFVSNGSQFIVNMTQSACSPAWVCPTQNPFGGIAVGDVIIDGLGYLSSANPATISAVNSISYSLSGVSITPAAPQQYLAVTGSQFSNLQQGEMLGNGAPLSGTSFNSWVPVGTYISSTYTTGTCPGIITPGPCIAINKELACPSGAPCQANLVASGVFTITVNQAISCPGPCQNPDVLHIFNDRFRLVASLYTGSDSSIVGFSQNGNTFLLNSPAPDILASLSPQTATQLVLHSVPTGRPADAFGRCVASGLVHIFSPSATPGSPELFPTAPGYDTQQLNGLQTLPKTSFPFHVWTDAASHVYAEGNNGTSNTNLYCLTDGYVIHR